MNSRLERTPHTIEVHFLVAPGIEVDHATVTHTPAEFHVEHPGFAGLVCVYRLQTRVDRVAHYMFDRLL